MNRANDVFELKPISDLLLGDLGKRRETSLTDVLVIEKYSGMVPDEMFLAVFKIVFLTSPGLAPVSKRWMLLLILG